MPLIARTEELPSSTGKFAGRAYRVEGIWWASSTDQKDRPFRMRSMLPDSSGMDQLPTSNFLPPELPREVDR